ncbi:alpha/beta hydrolase [Caballeronia sp. LZ033]|uniref:alpha/beta fold hydrolase n=1 Tax=Caballeronia sp. LZ033 TaxID=3038566 RepID=UPI002865781E|nr:alpha/beta hydrolase [Caballeronia sp. LZ033]MDR5818682.1 alpha/beta hydrolase [Caballeronia sp. LZ033]
MHPIVKRNNIQITGSGRATMVFAHGFGCDQTMWRSIVPAFRDHFRVVLFDLVGAGHSDLSAWNEARYESLDGYASDLIEVIDACSDQPVVHVGHSVSAIIALLAANESPDRFAANLMIAPSPSFINDTRYVGGFERIDIEELLESLDNNYLGWSSKMAPVIMGAPDQPYLSEELTNSFCRTDPAIARHFARVTFLSDHRSDLQYVTTPTLIIQSDDDLLAPVGVGEFMHDRMRESTLTVVNNVGHCPHMSVPADCVNAMNAFLKQQGM